MERKKNPMRTKKAKQRRENDLMNRIKAAPEDFAAFAEERKKMSLRCDMFKKLMRNAFAAFAVGEVGGYTVERDEMGVFDARKYLDEYATDSPKITFEFMTHTAPGSVNPLDATWEKYCAAKRVKGLIEAFGDAGNIQDLLKLSVDSLRNRLGCFENAAAIDGSPAVRFSVFAVLEKNLATDICELYKTLSGTGDSNLFLLVKESDDDRRTVGFYFDLALRDGPTCWRDCRPFLEIWLGSLGLVEEAQAAICRWCVVNKYFRGLACEGNAEKIFFEMANGSADVAKDWAITSGHSTRDLF